MDEKSAARLKVISSMFIFGTISLFVRSISLPSSVTAMLRALIGAPFLLLVMLLRRKRPASGAIRANLPLLCLSGLLMGFNWILLFEAYRYTTVATATLCYYMTPIIIVALSPFIFKERIMLRKVLCVLAAFVGVALVSGVAAGGAGASQTRGVTLALSAAVLYAAVVICNKKISGIDSHERTVVQLVAAALTLLVYNLATGSFAGCTFPASTLLPLLALGMLHTGFAYYLYFGSMSLLPSQALAMLSYIDPAVAVLLSALLLREPLGITRAVGAALILGAAIVSELPARQRERHGA